MASPSDDPWETDDKSFTMYNLKMAAFKDAAEKGEIDSLKSLLPDWSDDTFLLNDGLYLAASNGHIEIVHLLMQYNVDKHYWNSSADENVLSVAVANGHADVAELLLTSGCDGGLPVKGDKHTPLHSACKNGNLQSVNALLRRRVFIDAKDVFGVTALMVASREGHVDVVKALLEAKADPRIKTRVKKETAFTMAVDEDKAACVQELLRACPEEAKNDFKGGLKPLHHAIRYEKNEVACAMIDAGASVNFVDSLWTPIHLALESNNLPLVNVLAACGADINGPLPLPKNVTLLMLAVTKNKPEMVAALADKRNCNIDQFDETGRTALFFAAKFGYIKCLDVLIENYADPDAYAAHMVQKKMIEGIGKYPCATPLHAAVINDCPAAAVSLIGAGCNYNFPAFFEEDDVVNMFTPLQIACLKNSYWAVLMFIELLPSVPDDILKWCRHHGTDSPVFLALEKAIDSQKIKSAMSLKKNCRKYLRHEFGFLGIYQKIKALDLPKSLQDFLLYSDLHSLVPAT